MRGREEVTARFWRQTFLLAPHVDRHGFSLIRAAAPSRQMQLFLDERPRALQPPHSPVPVPGGLGIHLTFDLGGQARFGPDVEWVDRVDYGVDPARAQDFYDAIRRYWPGLPDGALVPAGIRPRTSGPGGRAEDFVIQGPDVTGHAGYIALYGIDSTGLTASLAIADYVADLVVA